MEKEEKEKRRKMQRILNNIIGYSQMNGNLLQKYNDHFYLNYFDRIKIDQTAKRVHAYQHRQLQIYDFVKLFLSVIDHTTDETLYLVMSLTRLYRKIKEETRNQKGIRFSDFTSFLCNKISEGDPDLIIPMKEIPLQTILPNTSKIRDIDINPPRILIKAEIERPKITKDKNKKDKLLEEKKPVAKFIFSHTLKSIITLGRLSSSISLYEPKDLNVLHKILPSTCRLLAKDVAILSMAFCEKEQRIGCVINNIGITFWEAADNFCTEKILGLNMSDYDPKGFGEKIYYLNMFQQWVTADKDTIYFWDLKQEKVTNKLKKQGAKVINDICEVVHLRALLVSYNLQHQNKSQFKQRQTKPSIMQKLDQKMLILYQDGKQKAKLQLDNAGCHSLCYNPATQLIVCLGYHINICIYEVDIKTFDIQLVTQLNAHSSILTCVANLPDSSMIVSGDDIGYLKLWDLNYMRCLQSVKIAKQLTQLAFSDGMLIYSDSRINTVPMQQPNSNYRVVRKPKDEQIYGIYQFFRKEEQTLWIISRKEARQISIHTGRIKNIFVLCNWEEDISAAVDIFNGFIIGTSKGEMSKFSLDGSRKWRIMAHEGEIHSIKLDMHNHFIITVGGDNNLFIWPQKSISPQQGPRKRISFGMLDINLLQSCPYTNLLLVGSLCDNCLTIWNYDNLKLAARLQFHSSITTFLIMPNKSSFIVATIDGCLYTFIYLRKDGKLKIQMLNVLDVNLLGQGQCKGEGDEEQEGEEVEGEGEEEEGENGVGKGEGRTFVNRLSYCEDSNLIIGSTPKGRVYSFSPTNLPTNPNYRQSYQPPSILKRPMKQSLQTQLLKSQYISLKVTNMQICTQSEIIALWNTQIHKDSIYFLNIINLQKKYACTLCVDGYFKLTKICYQSGVTVCSNKLGFPLPVKWDIDVSNYCELKEEIYQAISIVDGILKNCDYQLTNKEQSSLNISDFMDKMMVGHFNVQKLQNSANIMKEEFSQADIKQILQKQVTLKSLQAYKRLQLIKRHTQPQTQPHIPQFHYQTSSTQKQSIRSYLSPNYFPKLMNRHTQGEQKSKAIGYDLVTRLEGALNQQENKRFIDKSKQNRFPVAFNKMQTQQDQNGWCWRSGGMGDRVSMVADKTVKEILAQINTKLCVHKRNRQRASLSEV